MSRINIPLLIVSLLISITLWLVVLAKDIPQPEAISLKVIPQNLLTDKWYVKSVPSSVALKFIAPADDMQNIRDSRRELIVDFSHATAGAHRYPASLGDANFTQFLDAKNPSVLANLEPKVAISMTVKVREVGTFNEADLKPVVSKVTPEKVTVIGPPSILSSISGCAADLHLDDIDTTSGSSISSLVNIVNDQGKAVSYPSDAVSIEPNSVSINYAVTAANQEKSAIVNANFIGNLAPGFRERTYSISPSTVRLNGDPSALVDNTAVETDPVDINGLTRSRAFRVRVRVPAKLKASPSTVLVRVAVEPIPGYSPGPTEPPNGTSANPSSPSGDTAGRGGA
jgi:YbbR domain-containing protein